MIESVAVSPPVQATLLVGFVFLQAVALYVGYGVIVRIGKPLINTMTDA